MSINKAIEEQCRNGTMMFNNNTHGELLSPGYVLQENYPVNINCSWIISAPLGKVITITFNVSKYWYSVFMLLIDLYLQFQQQQKNKKND